MNKIISLGVGIQSSALYYMSSLGELDRVDYAIFGDTGGEKSSTLRYYEYMLGWSKENNGVKLVCANYKNLEKDLLSNEDKRVASIPYFTLMDGRAGMMRRQCTSEYKIQQVNKKYRELLGIGGKRFPQTEVFMGITIDEMSRMTIPREKWKINVYPFCGYKIYSDGKCMRYDSETMTRNDILNWYNKNDIPIPDKSACKFCPFQSDENWIRLKNGSPSDFEDACVVDDAIRNPRNKNIKSKLFLHSSLKPLRDVNFNESQRSLWGNCSDACDI